MILGWLLLGAMPAFASDAYQTIPTRTPVPEATTTNPPQPTSPPGDNSTPEPTAVTTDEPPPAATATVIDLASTPVGGYLPTAAPCGSPTVQSLSSRVNVRQGPGPDYEIIAELVYFQVQPIIGRSAYARWWQISLPDNTIGWVAHAAIVVQGNVALAPLVSAPPLNGITPTPGPVWNLLPDPTCPPVPTATATPTGMPPTVTAPATAASTAPPLAATVMATDSATAVTPPIKPATTATLTPANEAVISPAAVAVAITRQATATAATIPLDPPDNAGGGLSWLLYSGAALILAGIVAFVVRARQQ